MKKSYQIFTWKKAPFLRLLVPLIIGIVLQFYAGMKIEIIIYTSGIASVFFFAFSFLPESLRFRFRMIQGIIITIFLISCGSLLSWQKDVRNHTGWYGKYSDSANFIIATIKEPPVEKAKSFKAIALAESIINKGKQRIVSGDFLIYFSKDSASKDLKYGDQIILHKPLVDIKNSGNPGAFDYVQYAAFHQLFQQVYLRNNEWKLLKETNKKLVPGIIFSTRQNTVGIIEKFLGKNRESGIAKAILIGYKIDLDKDLVQAYSNAGVIHLIAISGLHMGIIYGVLLWIFSTLPWVKKSKPAKLVLIIGCLWIFALLTGASPSVLRAAVMFSFILAGKAFDKNSSVYNSLAASAFLLLCFNPFILFEVGFQLSYLAVFGIVIAQKNISNWIYFKNKWLQRSWQIAAVSLSAQLFTFPLCFYYFHQLPLLFVLSNMIAIPLATLALWGCLLLIFVSPVSIVAVYVGKIIYGIIWLLNHAVLLFDAIPFSLWDGVSISLSETILLYLCVSSFLYALMRKNRMAFKMAFSVLLIFTISKTIHSFQCYSQKKMIVYNIPNHKAIEFIDRNRFHFIGDSAVLTDSSLKNFNIKPAHISLQIGKNILPQDSLYSNRNFHQFGNLKLLFIDTAITYTGSRKVKLDYVVISKNPKLKIASLVENFDVKKLIFDYSNPSWKVDQWKKECEELHLQFHSVSEQGAFVVNL
ncbi:MAG: ComEC/Rec2 family competence protein [Ginsengibacter sp.]